MQERPRRPLRIIRYARDGTPVYDLGATKLRIGGTRRLSDEEMYSLE